MSILDPTWTRELIAQRRELHAALDRLALADRTRAAQGRLELYAVTHQFERGELDVAQLAEALRTVENSVTLIRA